MPDFPQTYSGAVSPEQHPALHSTLEVYAGVLEKARLLGTPAILGAMAELGRRDLFFLLTRLLGRKDAENEFVFRRCREVQANPDGYLDLWAREHFKSTIITFALSIHNLLLCPELSVGIFSHTRNVARAFLKQIKRELESNVLLKSCYPEELYANPARESPQWNEDGGIILRRKGNPKEASVEAWGLVDGQPTGKHFDILVFDDVVTRESVSTPEQIAKTTEAWELALNLGARDGSRRVIGTRYHFNDTYSEILRRGAAIPRIYPATTDGTPEGEPVLLSREALAAKRRDMGPYIFGCQMLQNPKADAVMGFKEEWLRFAEISGPESRIPHAGMNLYLLCDPAGSKKQGSDYTVMAVIGLGRDRNYYLIDALRDRLNLTERAAALLSLHRLYLPLGVGYERYGMQADIEHIQAEQERQGYRFPIIELGGPMPKPDRIRRLIPLFEQGRFYLPRRLLFTDSEGRTRDFTQEFIREEYLAFPVAGHDDMLDCVARITEADLSAVFPASRHAPAKARDNFRQNFFKGVYA
jgi:predicted phage terminase large subunit-like protein